MGKIVFWICKLLLRVLLPARGRHRAAPAARAVPTAPAMPMCRCQLALHSEGFEWDTPLTRPYLRDLEVSA
ncbi:hypothetical protein ACFFS2_06380 [Streptomyces aurantiacus]|uniref:Uncharacterized protein n=1 Tax=Streptomyces aurantiacus TaxID=47760 RepID=A0A7G1P212_9ACTN|nr:hypothetical protein [Streptomyces aurantiacus]BCL29052.1 hypothetical protein GCM10017557_39110 [Streptomyces aurantiacus]